jgi:hypothetical protein
VDVFVPHRPGYDPTARSAGVMAAQAGMNRRAPGSEVKVKGYNDGANARVQATADLKEHKAALDKAEQMLLGAGTDANGATARKMADEKIAAAKAGIKDAEKRLEVRADGGNASKMDAIIAHCDNLTRRLDAAERADAEERIAARVRGDADRPLGAPHPYEKLYAQAKALQNRANKAMTQEEADRLNAEDLVIMKKANGYSDADEPIFHYVVGVKGFGHEKQIKVVAASAGEARKLALKQAGPGAESGDITHVTKAQKADYRDSVQADKANTDYLGPKDPKEVEKLLGQRGKADAVQKPYNAGVDWA